MNLKIGGQAIAAGAAPNTTVALVLNGARVGSVVVNRQVRVTSGGVLTALTSALEITLTTSAFGLGAGAKVVIGRSSATMVPIPAGFAGGEGYAVRAVALDGALKAGPTPLAYVPCAGGSVVASAANANVPGLLAAGAIKTTTRSLTTPSTTSSVVTEVAGLNVLSGLITADAITASTTAQRATSGGLVALTNNSKIARLKIVGFPAIGDSVPPNTRIVVPLLGTITINKVTRTSTSIRVVMIEVVLNRVLGALPTGSTIEIGVSQSAVR